MGLFFVSYPLPTHCSPAISTSASVGKGLRRVGLREARSRVVMVCKSFCWVDMQPPPSVSSQTFLSLLVYVFRGSLR